MRQTILIVDDEPVQRRLLEAAVTRAGYNVLKATTGNEALELLAEHKDVVSVVILDLLMPGMSGMEVLRTLNQSSNPIPVIVQTAQGGIETVVNAMREGAFDFVVKPVAPERVIAAVEKAVKFNEIRKPVQRLGKAVKSGFTFDDIVSKDSAMVPVLSMGRKAAASNIPVLIEGESGVGKELIARAIHGSSARSGKPMITVNCGALPENLVESLLFGHEKGAFTGASEKHVGKFEEADGGTLFLDEVGELPLDLQVKLLRAIQEGEIDPVGAKRSIKVDVRLVSATNRSLLSEVKAGRFREDLYYRLNVLPMTIPPLRQRQNDIQPLVFHFVKKFAREENNKSISAIHPAAMKALAAYNWPGNIRELENAIFRAIVLCESEELGIHDFPQIVSQLPGFDVPETAVSDRLQSGLAIVDAPDMQTPQTAGFMIGTPVDPVPSRAPGSSEHGAAQVSPTGNYGMIQMITADSQIKPLEVIEGEAIRFAIDIYNGRMSEVARRLGIGRSTLYRKLKEHDLEEHIQQD